MQLVCKDSKDQKAMVKMLESKNKEKNFLFLDPGNASIRLLLDLGNAAIRSKIGKKKLCFLTLCDRLSNPSCGCQCQ